MHNFCANPYQKMVIIQMEVGIENCLHIKFEYNKSKVLPHLDEHSLFHLEKTKDLILRSSETNKLTGSP
jgi:Vacuolar protein sorting-associated protein 26